MARPLTNPPAWATDSNYASGPVGVIGTPTKVAPPSALLQSGFQPGEATAAQWFNSLVSQYQAWLDYVADSTADSDLWWQHDGVVRNCSIAGYEGIAVYAGSDVIRNADLDGSIVLTIPQSQSTTLFFRARHESRQNPMYDEANLYVTLSANGGGNANITFRSLKAPAAGGLLTAATLASLSTTTVAAHTLTGTIGGARYNGHQGGGFLVTVEALSGTTPITLRLHRIGLEIISSGPTDI